MFAVPLEANPESFNGLAAALGLETALYSLHDVWGLDDELLALVPQPVEAVIVLFPNETKYSDPKRQAEDAESAKKQPVQGTESIVYFRQKHGNHCGTIVGDLRVMEDERADSNLQALLHALGNTPSLPISTHFVEPDIRRRSLLTSARRGRSHQDALRTQPRP